MNILMDSIDEEVLSESDSGNESPTLSTSTKRKKSNKLGNPLKKIKYENISKEKSSQKNELYKAPTVEELNHLKETENLYNNNLFRLQIEELLREVELASKTKKRFVSWYERFNEVLNNFPEYESTLSEVQKETKHLAGYSCADTIICDMNLSIKFKRPVSIDLVGLYALEALPGPVLQTTINLTMPQDCFVSKDYLNNRYFVKRYQYCKYIAKMLLDKSLCSEITWSILNGNEFLPVITLEMKKIKVIIQVTPEDGAFRPSRFLCNVTNIRKDVFGHSRLFEDENLKNSPKVYYNNAVAHDVTFNMNNQMLKDTLTQVTNIRDAIKLIRIWLMQRELTAYFADFLIVYLMSYLSVKKRINKHMSSYQIVRIFWNFILESDFAQNPISLCEDTKIDEFKNYYDVVFLDKTGCYNILGGWTSHVYFKIRRDCEIALKLMDSQGLNSFHCLFITKVPTQLQFDAILSITNEDNFESVITAASTDEQIIHYGSPKTLILRKITDVLSRGLNKRAFYIAPLPDQKNDNRRIDFGISLDSAHAFNFLEMGPALNDPKEQEFREFWGPLTTDRRFKDGSVCVAVYFQTYTFQEKRRIIVDIINYLLMKKLNLEYTLYYNNFERFIVNNSVSASYPLGSNEEGCLKAITLADELGKKLRALEIPLAITGIQGTSDVFCFSEVFPPIATSYQIKTNQDKHTSLLGDRAVFKASQIEKVPMYVGAIECVLQIEQSSKWPRDLEALRHMKTAFYLEIAKQLSSKHKIISNVTPDALSVLYEGLVFRYKLSLPREIGLVKKEVTNDGVTVYKDTVESKEMEKTLEVLPKIVGALKGIQAQYPSYGPSTALIKRWLRSQMIDDFHFPDVVINLLNASLYVNQTSYPIASVPQTGFLQFLKFISEFQEQIEPIIINFNDQIGREKLAEIDSTMLQNRQSLPNLCLITPYDDCQSLFTKVSPSKEIMRRIKLLSRETLKIWHDTVKNHEKINVEKLFMPNLSGYNALIHLNSNLNPHNDKNILKRKPGKHIQLPPFDASKNNKFPITGFNPVQFYLNDLRKCYGEFALFFHDHYGGNIIGVLWLPKTLQQLEFKVNNVYGRKIAVNGKLITNFSSIIDDFLAMGRGLVKDIKILTEI